MSTDEIEVNIVLIRQRPPSKKEVSVDDILAGQLTEEEVEAVLKQIEKTLTEYRNAKHGKPKP